MVNLEYLKMSASKKFLYRLKKFITAIPNKILAFFKAIPRIFGKFFKKIYLEFFDIWNIFKKGDFKTRISFLIFGFGQILRGQILRGLLFLIFEIVFILYMICFGWTYLADFKTLGTVASEKIFNEELMIYETKYYDNSMLILLYGLLTIFFIISFIYVWRLCIKQNGIIQEMQELGIKLKHSKDDLRSLGDEQYYKTLLSVPLLGIVIFTVLPIAFMILVAFTNYDSGHLPPGKLFTWVGLTNFKKIFGLNENSGDVIFARTFGDILIWTLVWAFFATFTNYFLGMIVALMINKKGIKGKKIFRTILVMTIAVPQFISLLLVSRMFAEDGIINSILKQLSILQPNGKIQWLTNGTLAKIMVILINIWVGIPYLMLITTGILMNIPEDLYESAKIDGATPLKTYMKITLPYMLFVTTPYLITSFIANINNFNVIYLLTTGAPLTLEYANPAGKTDLLITWLYKLTMTQSSDYKMAAVIGIMVFIVISVFSLIVYNRSGSVKNEEDFQ